MALDATLSRWGITTPRSCNPNIGDYAQDKVNVLS